MLWVIISLSLGRSVGFMGWLVILIGCHLSSIRRGSGGGTLWRGAERLEALILMDSPSMRKINRNKDKNYR